MVCLSFTPTMHINVLEDHGLPSEGSRMCLRILASTSLVLETVKYLVGAWLFICLRGSGTLGATPDVSLLYHHQLLGNHPLHDRDEIGGPESSTQFYFAYFRHIHIS